MFFLLRCIFWLSIVYVSILRADDWRHVPADTLRVGQQTLGKAEQTVVKTAVGYCTSRAGGCISEAEQLTALIKSGGDDTAGPVEPKPQTLALVPTPIPRPHDIDAARLTRRR